ncbi:MAG: Rpn family recombination-promoting nuclease/putative transposase [Gammaproteobacteria bacterium]|nr:Rpn family recombination-promoting nuclease/putative transposase [Gammaproteobacteria bacterium]MYE50106.1 Rpn family recombination-promoting nuclease/putative transposase [Gammaproteobacteria bacterium]MYF49281.1 Rpn family recombination-promoting nuclease/putative transposase [Gammaproteobacteria bacterium]MYH14364.1 Rpn family recombination-promoting nuclease/putative transposase [Gammaproteobacteria bacterium]MYK84535.1 Rpn family recombination-promoting nuclease/putative transposase [Ga
MIIHEGHDRAAKRIFGNVRTMRDVLRAFVAGEWVADLDLDTLRPLPGEHVGAELRRRRGDLLWMVDLKGGGSVVIAVEAQSTPVTRMPARTLTLTGLICEGFAAEAWGPGGQLPAVLPIVLYTGSSRWTPALDLAERVGPPAELSPYVAGPRYLLLDVRRMAKQDLPKRNLMSTFIRLESAGTLKAMEDVLRETFAWLGEDELTRAFLDWAVRVLIPLNFPDVDWEQIEDLMEGLTMLAETAKKWTEEWLAEGRVRGLEQGQRDMAVRQVRLKFGDAAAERLSSLLDRTADLAVLAEVGDWVIQCGDAAELLARVEAVAGSDNGQNGF